MTGDKKAQGEGCHNDTTTRMTAMTTIMQDSLQDRSDEKITITSSLLDVIRLRTDRLRLLLAFFFREKASKRPKHCFSKEMRATNKPQKNHEKVMLSVFIVPPIFTTLRTLL